MCIRDRTKVYELITKIDWTNQGMRNAWTKVENLLLMIMTMMDLQIIQSTAVFLITEKKEQEKLGEKGQILKS